jgi:hypothetical protein
MNLAIVFGRMAKLSSQTQVSWQGALGMYRSPELQIDALFEKEDRYGQETDSIDVAAAGL